MKHFGSVTVLNGHIHQVMQKVEGNVTFHTALSNELLTVSSDVDLNQIGEALHGTIRVRAGD